MNNKFQQRQEIPSAPVPAKTWLDVLTYQAQRQSHSIAQTFLLDGEDSEAHLTFNELETQTRAIAAVLQQTTEAGERALLLYPPGLEFTAAFMGCLFANIIAVPAYPPRRGKPDERLLGIMRDARPAVILTTAKIRDDLQTYSSETMRATGMRIIASDQVPAAQADEWRKPQVSSDSIAFVQYTSGSTGDPKGAMVTHGNLLHNAALMQRIFLPEEKVPVFWLPGYHDMGLIGGILQPLYLGIRSVRLSPMDFLQRPIRWLRAISRYRAATSGAPNFAYELCTTQIKPEQCAGLDLGCWTLAFSGAEPVRADTLDRFSAAFAPYGFRAEAFSPCYGMAEATLIITGVKRPEHFRTLAIDEAALTTHRVVATAHGQDSAAPLRTLVGCGRITAEQDVLLVDPETHLRCPEDQVGEVWLRGQSVARGYWNRPELSGQIFDARVIEADTGTAGDTGYLRTGDLGFVHEEELYITGRLKDIIIIRGRNHYPQDIEHCAERSHPALRAGCGAAFSIDDGDGEQLVIVYEVERRQLRSVDIHEVANAVRRKVAEKHGIEANTLVLLRTATIPKTSSGKIRRFACRESYIKNTLDVVDTWYTPTAGQP